MIKLEKRSLFQKVFGGLKRFTQNFSRLQMLSGYTPVFTPWSGDPYSADDVRAAVDAIARNAAKLKPRHIRRAGRDIDPVGGQIERVLQVRPNPNMSAYDFLYKLITTLMLENNAFAYPVWDGTRLEAIWPINCSMAEFIEDASKNIYIKFYFGAGQEVILPYPEVIHLRRHYYKNDMTGEANSALNSKLDAIHTTNEGIGQAVKTSANLRGLIKYQGMLKDSDIEANRSRFVAQYMTMQNSGGVAALDAKADYIPLNNEPKMVNAAQMKELRDAVYRYFGVNESIIKGDYTDQQWNAFYEGTIEPLAVQLSLEFTSKLFTERERGHGNEIMFEANRLQYTSARTKTEVVKTLMPMGLMSLNEAREIFNLGPVEDGDKRIVSLNYVNADKADLYQVGELGEQEGDGENGNQEGD